MVLLDRIKEIKSLEGYEVINRLASILGSSVYQIDPRGKIAYSNIGNDLSLSPDFKQRIGSIHETMANIPFDGSFIDGVKSDESMFITIVPGPFGQLLLSKSTTLSDDELILAEFAALQSSKGFNKPRNTDKLDAVKVLNNFSYSEIKILKSVFQELNGNEGHLVASQIAEKIGISKSILVNALHKLESSGIVDSRSLGIKGTYIKINDPHFLEALDKKVV